MDNPGLMMYISIVVLICLSAFFSASETAISTFNRLRMKKQAQDGSRSAQKALDIAQRYDKTLTTILVGNNIVNIGASTLATLVATSLLGASGAIVSTVVMTVLVLMFGEILPKTYSMDNADKVASRIAGPLSFFITILTPLSFVFSRFGRLFERDEDEEDAPSVTEEELMYIIESIEEEGVLEEQERELVQSALEFDETSIREIITPRVNLVALDIEDSREEILKVILEEGYSRMPVFENTVDNIIGILHTRDYLRCVIEGQEPDLRSMLKEPYFVPKGMRLSKLLSNLKARKVNIAVVLDEYGGTLGIVTMEDVLEELVGDLWDEDDEIPAGLTRLGDNLYEVTGSYDILDMLTQLGYDEDDYDSEHSTVGGFITHMLEHIPQVGETLDFLDLRFTVTAMDGHRVDTLTVEKYPPPLPGDQNGQEHTDET